MWQLSKQTTRRICRVDIQPIVLSEVIRRGVKNKVTSSGVPDSATLVGEGYDPYGNVFFLLYEDSSFSEVHPGDLIPKITPSLTVHYAS